MQFAIRLLVLSCMVHITPQVCAGDFIRHQNEDRVGERLEENLAYQRQIIPRKDDERAKQKAIFALIGAGAIMGLTSVLQNTFGFKSLGSLFNLTAGEFQAACGLSATFSALGLLANKEYAESFRSIAWRLPVMALVSGVVSHSKVNKALTNVPLGIGTWFEANPASGEKKGISGIYTIGTWYLLKPTMDRIEDYISGKTSFLVNYYTGNEEEK